MGSQPDFGTLAKQFDHPGVRAVVLLGSFARGEAGPFSDVDLVRFTESDETALPDSGSHLMDGRLVVVSDVTPTQVQDSFTKPEIAVENIKGLRSGRSLIDRQDTFSAIQQSALTFRWDNAMQSKANRWASHQMVGWIEEVHKGLEGLRSSSIGRLLHARFGCSWGLTRVMCVQRGILLSGDNALYEEVISAVSQDSQWAKLCRAVWGIAPEPHTLQAEVIAGLQLYRLTASMLANVIQPEDQSLIANTITLIDNSLSTFGTPGP